MITFHLPHVTVSSLWDLKRLFPLVRVRTKKKESSLYTIFHSRIFICTFAWSILDMRFFTVARYMCVRRSDVLGKKRRLVSCGCCSSLNNTSLTKILRCLFISPTSLSPSAINSWILLMILCCLDWWIAQNISVPFYKIWKKSVIEYNIIRGTFWLFVFVSS